MVFECIGTTRMHARSSFSFSLPLSLSHTLSFNVPTHPSLSPPRATISPLSLLHLPLSLPPSLFSSFSLSHSLFPYYALPSLPLTLSIALLYLALYPSHTHFLPPHMSSSLSLPHTKILTLYFLSLPPRVSHKHFLSPLYVFLCLPLTLSHTHFISPLYVFLSLPPTL
jgi:hypothetical protein